MIEISYRATLSDLHARYLTKRIVKKFESRNIVEDVPNYETQHFQC